MRSTSHPRIWSARQRRVVLEAVTAAVRSLRRACAHGDAEAALWSMEQVVEDFTASTAAWTAARASVAPRRRMRIIARRPMRALASA
jgi:hypothetical protein